MTVIVLSGPVGAGKSSLTAILSKYLGTKPFYESVDDNPVLAAFLQGSPEVHLPAAAILLEHALP
jgi:deoxyadenosine/deoxycytidine kinase